MTHDEYTALLAIVEGHTPGPWEQSDRADGGVMSANYPHRTIHSLPPRPYYDRGPYDAWVDANIANARLIAAAPDLLAEVGRLRAALKLIASGVTSGPSDMVVFPGVLWTTAANAEIATKALKGDAP